MSRTSRSTTSKAASNVDAKTSPLARRSKSKKQTTPTRDIDVKESQDEESVTPANTSRKRARKPVKYEEEEEEGQEGEEEEEEETKARSNKRVKTASAPKPKVKATPKSKSKPKLKAEPDFDAGAKLAANLTDDALSKPSPKSKQKANPYNLSPGTSPYPDYPHPTPEECQEVNDILAKVHGTIKAPKTISAPSLTTSGCGEVPSVLDALVRTRLSAATNNANSSRAFRGLVDRFGTLQDGVGKGSVDWNAVRQSGVKDVFEAIQSGGLADVKSRDIKKILDLVAAENEEARKRGADSAPPDHVLSLDHLHSMTSDDAFNKLLEYPGIGPKTASCVLLFCMQRPSFAVDTHVFRLTRWLAWTPSESQVRAMGKKPGSSATADAIKEEDAASTPSKAKSISSPAKSRGKPPPVTRNSTYSHLDVRIPDELKYPLHYLLIKHGKTCPTCSAKPDRKIKEEWGDKPCPIKHLKRGSKKKALLDSGEADMVKQEEDLSDDDEVAESGEEKTGGDETIHGLKV